ncbi:AraC-type transcriptional regulator N-terminus [Paenibacillus sp. 1_12]|nr:AraC-type transcriptional regulator N-terminus [Paenibacillus sp. 1_12]
MGRIVEASPEIPYLSLKLSFDAAVILEIVEKTNRPASVPVESGRGITVNQTSPVLLEVIVRLMQLLGTPEDISVLAPLIIREVLYRMLQGEQGALLYQFAISGSHAYNITQTNRLINRQYDRPLAIGHLTKSVNLSISALHKHFKRVTEMSSFEKIATIILRCF